MEMTLYKIADEFAQLVEADELPEDAEQRLDELTHALEVKAQNIIAISEKMQNFVDYCKAEEDRISAKRKAVENRIKWVKGYLQNCMEAAGAMVIETGTRKIALQKSPPSVDVQDEVSIPARYFITIPATVQLDKKAVIEALKSGEEVPGCQLKQSYHLRVR